MKKTARTIISAVLALSLSVVSCFALPILTANEVDFTATIASSNTVNVCANFSYSNAQINIPKSNFHAEQSYRGFVKHFKSGCEISGNLSFSNASM